MMMTMRMKMRSDQLNEYAETRNIIIGKMLFHQTNIIAIVIDIVNTEFKKVFKLNVNKPKNKFHVYKK